MIDSIKQKFGISNVSNLKIENVIFNYSHRVLTNMEKNVIVCDLRFCFPPKQVDKNEVNEIYTPLSSFIMIY